MDLKTESENNRKIKWNFKLIRSRQRKKTRLNRCRIVTRINIKWRKKWDLKRSSNRRTRKLLAIKKRYDELLSVLDKLEKTSLLLQNTELIICVSKKT